MLTNEPDHIPLLTGAAYRKAYFQRPTADSSREHPDAKLHFDLQGRQTWKPVIPAHRLDFYMVVLVTAGQGRHTLGLREHYVRKNSLCFISPTIISAWQAGPQEQCGYVCTFSDDFYYAGRDDRQFLTRLPFFQIDGLAVIQLTDEQMAYYVALFRLMSTTHEHRTASSDELLRGYLHALLHKAISDYPDSVDWADRRSYSGQRLVNAFTALYTQDFSALREGQLVRLRRVADYADALGVSQNHLNDTIKALTGQSAGQLLRTQLTKHATMCLTHSTKTISEIAYRLGFDDPAYFSRFYKRQTGQSPSHSR